MTQTLETLGEVPEAGPTGGPGGPASGVPRRDPERASIQSVGRALTLLETIAELGGETTLSRLASRTGLNISTCHHLLATLVQRGFVTKGLGRRGYALGARILYLSHACLQVDLPRRAQSALDRINQSTGETVHLAALQGDELVTVLKREARHAVRVDAGALGTSDAAHATATGKAMLAWLPEDEIRR
ncbi:MAG TPA: helix-turn-helix domain-containing protein, partial [Bradyrhizobium sp.]|nr:helix-turn-helix domain-containing protein [Bradyrhizobium sp.]